MVSVICIIAELLRPSFDFPLLLCYPFGEEGGRSMRILLCDDDESILTQLEGYLQEYFAENHLPEPELCRYTDGQRLLDSEDRPDAQRVDIAFLDVEMPGISGIEIGAKLKKQNPYLKVFIVTSYADYLDDAMRFHVFRYLSKPVDKQRLFRNLRDVLYQLSVDTKPVCIETVDGTNRRRSTEKGRTGECLSVHIINKSSKFFGVCVLEIQIFQPFGFCLLYICLCDFNSHAKTSMQDVAPESNVSGLESLRIRTREGLTVKKTCRWHVFRAEQQNGYCCEATVVELS